MSIEEQKIREGIRAGNEVASACEAERGPEIARPLGTELERHIRQGMAKRKPRGVERLPGGRPLQGIG